mgnify:CR=1 FL=1
MKHLLLSYLVLALLTIHPIYGYEVPTNVQKRNILLEEFTGIHCGYCPQPGWMVGSNLPIRRIRFLGRTGILSRFQYMVHEMSVFFFRDFQF